MDSEHCSAITVRVLAGALAFLVTLALAGSAMAAMPKAKHKARAIPAVSVLTLPSAKQCVTGRRLTIQLRKVAHVHWISATVTVNGKRVKTVTRAHGAQLVKLTGLPARTSLLSIKVTTSDRRSVTVTRTYKACVVAKPAVPPVPVPAPKPAPAPTPTPAGPPSLAPGSYSGSTSQGYGASFFVPADSKHLLDVSLPTVHLGCTPGGTPYDHLEIADIAVASDGSFSARTTQDGVFANSTARFTYTFSGRLQVASLSGTFREDVTYDNGTTYSCTSNDGTWRAARETQGTQTAPPLAAGSYSGSTLQGYGVSFYASPDSKHLLDVSLPTVHLACTPGGTPYDHLEIADIAVAADGSFSATTTQDGVFAGSAAHFTYTFRGHFHGTTTAGAPRVGGQFREDVTYSDGGAYACTSNIQSWSVVREAQGAQTAPPIAPGSYSGSTLQGYGVSFYASPDSRHLLDVSLPTVHLACTPGGTPYDHLEIGDVAVAADGSFTATTTQEGVLAGSAAHFTYTFSGHFHGTTSAGAGRVGGVFREDISYSDGTEYTCTSDNQTWSVVREAQGAQTAPPIASGSYSGSTLQGYGVSFTVPSGSAHLQNVNLPTVHLGCTPAGTPYDKLQIDDIAVAADGSFSATTTQDGVFAGSVAHFTYTFSGHFHGTTSAGAARLGGRFREDITYNDGTAHSCTSNTQTWSATHA
jgi:hypothetical protein